MFSYKNSTDFLSRKAEAEKICKSWPDKIPIVLEKELTAKIPELDKLKILCPKEFSVMQFLTYIRKRIKLPKKTCLFIATETGDMLSGDKMMMDIYQKSHDNDGFLYLKYGDHAAFG